MKWLYDILRNYIVVYKYLINVVAKILPDQLFSMLLYQGLKSKYMEIARPCFKECNVGMREFWEGCKEVGSRTWVTHFHLHRDILSSKSDNCASIPKSEHMKPSLHNWGRAATSWLLITQDRESSWHAQGNCAGSCEDFLLVLEN